MGIKANTDETAAWLMVPAFGFAGFSAGCVISSLLFAANGEHDTSIWLMQLAVFSVLPIMPLLAYRIFKTVKGRLK